jgi:Flp pilus assembly protein TadG
MLVARSRDEDGDPPVTDGLQLSPGEWVMGQQHRSADSPPSEMPHSRGQGLVEFALVLPVMMLILLVAVDAGRLFFTYIEVNNAAREAASVASQHIGYSRTILESGAQNESNVQGQGGEGTLTVTPTTPICTSAAGAPNPTTCPASVDAAYVAGAGHLVTVAVSRPFTFLTPMIGAFFPPTGVLTLGASASAPVMPVVSSGGGGGGTPPNPCDAFATFIFSQANKNANVVVDASDSTPGAGCPTHIVSYQWSFDTPPGTFGTA